MKKSILFVGLILSLMSCQDVLQEDPKSIVEERFYNTAGEVETAVNAIFPPLRAYNAFGALFPWQLESYSDFIHGRGSYAILSEMQGLNSTNITRIGSMWDQFYLAIRNANLVIKNAPNATNINEEAINQYLAEARFMRAFIYFNMIQKFGKLVLRTESNMEELHIPLSKSEEVYNQILEDLVFAEQHLSGTPSSTGRPTVWAAKSVLAHVYLVRGDYAGTMEKANEVINSGNFALVEVNTAEDFQNLYGPDIDNTEEEIFYIKYNSESGWPFVEFLHHPEDPYYNGAGLFAHYIDTTEYSVWNKWDEQDLRKQLFYPWDFGLGPHTMLNNKFMDTERTGAAGNDYPFYRYADILLMYAEAAARVNNGPTHDAIEKLNMVHRRAYGKSSTQPSEIDFELSEYPDLESFLDLVIMERGYETYLEGGKRWLDLIRLGRERTREIIKEGTGKDVADRHFLWPIPETEIELNDGIDQSDQNPGY